MSKYNSKNRKKILKTNHRQCSKCCRRLQIRGVVENVEVMEVEVEVEAEMVEAVHRTMNRHYAYA